MTPSELPDAFHDYVAKGTGADGWALAPGWILDEQGKLTVLAMDLPPDQIYLTMVTKVAELNATAFAFAVDRFAKPGQGTVRSDLLAGHISTSGARGVRPFIIEYDPATGAVDPMNFDNAFWNAALITEFLGNLRK